MVPPVPLRATAPAIWWGDAYDKVLFYGFPAAVPLTYPQPVLPADVAPHAIGGGQDGWSWGSEARLVLPHPAIPATTLTDPWGYGDATGWDDADGWADFLRFARTMAVLRLAQDPALYVESDATTYLPCQLIAPWDDAPAAGWALTRSVRLELVVLGHPRVDGY